MECMCTKRKQILGFGVDLFSFEDAMQYVHNCLKENSLDEFFIYANEQLKKLCDNYKITYLDIYNEFNDSTYFDNPNSYFPNKAGYKLISSKIIDIIVEKNNKNA